MDTSHIYRFSRVPEPMGYAFRAICLECRASIPTDGKWADLNGEPYRAYYCDTCKRALEVDK